MTEPLSLKVGVHPNHFLYGTYESRATKIKSLNATTVPAIAQPPNMMAALSEDPFTRSMTGQTSSAANRNFRDERNNLLLPKLESGNTAYDIALGERAINQAICTPDALSYMRELNRKKLVTVKVLPGDARTTADWDGGFVLINWSDGSQNSEVGVTNDGDEMYFHHSDEKLAKLRARWEEINNHAEPLEGYLSRMGYVALSTP